MGKSNCRGGRWRALALSCALALAGCCHLDHLNLKPPAPRTLFTSPVQWLPAAQFVGKAAFNSISSNFGQELYLSGYIYASGNIATAIIVRTLDGGQS